MLRCKDCGKWGDGEGTWDACDGLEYAVKGVNAGGLFKKGSQSSPNCEPVETHNSFGCPWGEKRNPRCPVCGDGGKLNRLGNYICDNDECKVMVFKGEEEC